MKSFFMLRSAAVMTMIFLCGTRLFSQITINNTLYTPTQLVSGVLIPVSSGTQVSNVTFSGVYNSSNKYQVGYFSTATTTLAQMGFTDGVVLSTGNTSDLPLTLGTDPRAAAQMATGYTSCTTGEIRKTGTCPSNINDLNVLSGGYNYYNAAILEFDFIPVQSMVQFRYIFGSEEYEDNSGIINYQCSSYNDKFGFLISGPGINGGQGYTNNAKNIAVLANGSEVSINSVNNGVVGSSGGSPSASKCQTANPAWVQNVSTAEFLGTIDGTECNGNTIILVAQQSGLTPGQTYHIKLIVTDVNDATYDSVVYLEAGSFTTQTANAGSNQTLCATSTTLNASSPATGTWTVISGTGNFINANSPTSMVSGMSVGPNVFQWSDGSAAATVTVTVNAPPTVTASSSGNISCTASTSTLTATASNATVVWNGGSLTNASNPAVVSAAGTYTATATDPVTGCTNTTTVTVTGNTTPPSVTCSSSNNIDCAIPTATLTATSPGSNIVWDGGSLSSASNPAVVSAAGTYTATATDPSNGCTSTATVTVTASGTLPNISIAPATQIDCINSSAVLTGSSTTSGVTYQWTGGPASATYTVSSGGTYTLTVTETATGCSAVQSATVSVDTIHPQVTAGSPATLTCAQSSVTISVNSSITGSNYNWTGPGIVSGGSTAGPTVNVQGNYTVTVTNPANGCSFMTSVNVSNNTTPPDVTAGPAVTLDCANSNVSLSVSSLTPGASFSWSGPGIVSGSTTSAPVVNLPGTYSVVVTDPVNGCTSATTVNVSGTPGPTAVAGADITIASGTNITLTAGGGGNYLWNTGDTTLDLSVAPTVTTEYCVTVTDANGCTDSDCITVYIEAECGNLFIPNAFSPNGDLQNDTLYVRGGCVTEMNFVIYDRWGEKVFTSNDQSVGWDGTYRGVMQDPAVFTYYFSGKINGTFEKRQGNVTLMR